LAVYNNAGGTLNLYYNAFMVDNLLRNTKNNGWSFWTCPMISVRSLLQMRRN